MDCLEIEKVYERKINLWDIERIADEPKHPQLICSCMAWYKWLVAEIQ